MNDSSSNLHIMRIVGVPFATLQGEGFYAGVSSVFVRTAGCNLRCHAKGDRFFTCDTPDSLVDYRPNAVEGSKWLSSPSAYAADFSPGDVAEMVMHSLSARCYHLVVTGGEPTLQSDALALFLGEVQDRSTECDPIVTLETNCTLFSEVLCEYVSLVSMSPKLEVYGDREKRVMMEWLSSRVPVQLRQLKIVCGSRSDVRQAYDVYKWASELNPYILFYVQASSPAGMSVRSTDYVDHLRQIADETMMCGSAARFSFQMHKLLGLQ